MPFVLDASITLSWVLRDEEQPVASAALERSRDDAVHVPAIWWFEVRNALIMNERRGRLAEDDTGKFLGLLSAISVTIDRQPDERSILSLARNHGLTVYDAGYLELAKRLDVPLATLDGRLTRAAVAEQITIVGAP